MIPFKFNREYLNSHSSSIEGVVVSVRTDDHRDRNYDAVNKVSDLIEEAVNFKNSLPVSLHIIKVTTVFSGIKAAKVKLESQRFPHNKAVLLSYSDFTENNNQDIAAKWLNDNGYPVVAIAEGKNCMFVLTNAFKPLVK